MTSKERVYKILQYENPDRIANDMWLLPWAYEHRLEGIKKVYADFEFDIGGVLVDLKEKTQARGNMYENGESIDDWGCVFTNKHKGVIGEVKNPIVCEDDWNDAVRKVHIPYELTTFDVAQANDFIQNNCKDKFVISNLIARPFEQLQFMRGTENLYMDLMYRPKKMFEFIEKMDAYYVTCLEKWAKTNVDALFIMDDWGSQNNLLISPTLWNEIFAPLYRKYIDIAHKYGKKMFMHSDGNTLSIIPKLIDMGLDAINCQMFCIGIENLKPYRNKITFWGEVDRQNLLPFGTEQEVREGVKRIYDNLWANGGCIAQCEFGAGANADNVYTVFDEWKKLTSR